MTKRAAIILAGGKAKRFQTSHDKWQDKALAELNGKPLLVHAIENIQDIVDEIVVVVNENESRISQYQNVLEKYQCQKSKNCHRHKNQEPKRTLNRDFNWVKICQTQIIASRFHAMYLCLTEKLLNTCLTKSTVLLSAVPMWPNGRLETLLMVLERKSSLEIANVLCQLGRSHPDDIIRGSINTLFVSPLGEIKSFRPRT